MSRRLLKKKSTDKSSSRSHLEDINTYTSLNINKQVKESTKPEEEEVCADLFGNQADDNGTLDLLQKKRSDTITADLEPKQPTSQESNKLPWDSSDFVSEKKERIQDKYIFQKPPLGDGLFGTVYKVRHRETGVVRAVKAINKSKAKVNNLKDLLNDVEILKKLDHPNIIKVYEFFQDPSYYFIVTEYCSGGELFERIMAEKQFTEKKAASMMRDMLSAIVYCHDKNLVHCDLKPENVLYSCSHPTDSTLKIIDFGNSNFCEPGTTLKNKLGTVYYVAPEVLKGAYNNKCDVWSLGVILYLLLSGKPPFNGPSDQKIFEKIFKGDYSMDGPEWTAISKEAKDLISKMLTYNFDDRISARDCLSHPWFQCMLEAKELRMDLPIGRRSIRNLKDFRKKNKLQEAILYFLVNQLTSSEEKNELLKQFLAIDKDGDGLLTMDDLIKAYEKTGMDTEEAILTAKQTISNVDKSESGAINYTEFITATISKRKLFSQDRLQHAFKMFDVDNKKYITVGELKSIFNSGVFLNINDEIWNNMVEKFSSEGKIDYETFCKMMVEFTENEKVTQSIRNSQLH